MIKCALVGMGYWGRKIINYIIPENGFDLKYAVSSKFDKRIIWNDSDIEAVFVITPIDTHYEIIKTSLMCGKHVFTEKPITLKTTEAEEIVACANTAKRSVVVDYVHTFSRGLELIKWCVSELGEIKYIEGSAKHLGRFLNFDVYWLLASHLLSVLDMFVDIDALEFSKKDYLKHNLCDMELTSAGSIYFDGAIKGRLDVSTNYTEKEFYFRIYGKKGTAEFNLFAKEPVKIKLYKKEFGLLPKDLITENIEYSFDESNNLKYAIKYFRDAVLGSVSSNAGTAIKITRVLENLKCEYVNIAG